MKGWITVALAVTFLSGASTGFLLGRSQTDPERLDWKDKYLETLEGKFGVTGAEDLDRVRAILDTYDKQVQALKVQLPKHLRDEIWQIGKQAEAEIQGIIDSYRTPEKAPR